jgi:hypothetical protein
MGRVISFIILGLIGLAGCQSEFTEVHNDDNIEAEIAVAINQGQPAEKIEQLVLQADDPSKAASIAAWRLMQLWSIPTEIEKYWSYYKKSDTSSTPTVEIFEIINRYKISVLRVLIPHGINLNQHYYGSPFISWSGGGGSPPITPELLTFLLENGYDPNLNGKNPSALGSCTHPGQAFWRYDHKYEMIKALLKHGANPNDSYLSKPILHQLIIYNKDNPYLLDIVKLLLEAGAEVNVVDKRGETPLDAAWSFKKSRPDDIVPQEIIECLENFGAKRSTEL